MINRRQWNLKKGKTGFTLLEVVIVLALFSGILAVTLVTLDTSSSVQQSQKSQTDMQTEARNMVNDIKKHLGEARLSVKEVDTRMRWLDQPDGEWETYDKFHTWYYTKDRDGNYYPAMLQCPEETCGWAMDGSNPEQKFTTFVSNYNYHTGSSTPDHHSEFYYATTESGKGFARSGRVYNDLYRPKEHYQYDVNPFYNGGITSARCIKGNGAFLTPLVQLDVLQFPTPRNLKYDYVTNEGDGWGPDNQGWIIYAPFYDLQAENLELRRYGLFLSDLFDTLPWNGNQSPVYASGAPDPAGNSVDANVADIADRVAPIQTSDYNLDYNEYNQVEEDGSTSTPDRPPDWQDDSGNVELTLKEFFDFNGDNLIETDLDVDGNNQITYGTTRGETESTIEQFRLYPSTSSENTSGRFADWTEMSHINDTNALIYHKYSDKNLRNADTDKPYLEMEVYYFIDLGTGWTRFYYFCRWDKDKNNSSSGSEWYSINASFIRKPFNGMDQNYASSPFYVPYTTIGDGLIGLDFSTSKTYPDDITSGISDNRNSVRIGLLLDKKMMVRGQYKYPLLRQETMLPLTP